jgi:multidrug resistance efflux pump
MNSLTENTGDFNRSLYSISESQLETAARGIAKARAALAEAQAIARQKLKAQELAHKETTQAIKEIKRAEAALAEAEAWEATQGNPS